MCVVCVSRVMSKAGYKLILACTCHDMQALTAYLPEISLYGITYLIDKWVYDAITGHEPMRELLLGEPWGQVKLGEVLQHTTTQI